MNEAIKLAEANGFKIRNSHLEEDVMGNTRIIEDCVITDPLFWQALNKALHLDTKAAEISSGGKNLLIIGWKDFAHYYFELTLTNGNTEQFWKELIKQ